MSPIPRYSLSPLKLPQKDILLKSKINPNICNFRSYLTGKFSITNIPTNWLMKTTGNAQAQNVDKMLFHDPRVSAAYQ
jgi:hypothetical protein